MQEYQQTQTHEAAPKSKNSTEDEYKSKLQQSECNINNLKATISYLTKKIESLNQTVQLMSGQLEDVSTCKVGTVTTSKWTEILPAFNIVKVPAHNVVS